MTEPPAKRSRTMRACQRCRAAKAACSQERPCHRCLRLGLECIAEPGDSFGSQGNFSSSAFSPSAERYFLDVDDMFSVPSAANGNTARIASRNSDDLSMSESLVDLPLPMEALVMQTRFQAFSDHVDRLWNSLPEMQRSMMEMQARLYFLLSMYVAEACKSKYAMYLVDQATGLTSMRERYCSHQASVFCNMYGASGTSSSSSSSASSSGESAVDELFGFMAWQYFGPERYVVRTNRLFLTLLKRRAEEGETDAALSIGGNHLLFLHDSDMEQYVSELVRTVLFHERRLFSKYRLLQADGSYVAMQISQLNRFNAHGFLIESRIYVQPCAWWTDSNVTDSSSS